MESISVLVRAWLVAVVAASWSHHCLTHLRSSALSQGMDINHLNADEIMALPDDLRALLSIHDMAVERKRRGEMMTVAPELIEVLTDLSIALYVLKLDRHGS